MHEKVAERMAAAIVVEKGTIQEAVPSDGSHGRVWGFKGQRAGEAAHPGPTAAPIAMTGDIQQLREELAAVKQQLSVHSRQWYLHPPGCRCMLCAHD